jgi:zinc protease
MLSSDARAIALLVLAAAAGCGHEEPAAKKPRIPLVSSLAKVRKPSQEPADALGPRPAVSAAPRFSPPVPVVYTRSDGMTVWLLERRTMPLVAVDLVVPAGSARDPEGKGGLALATANMLDEGAAGRGALEIARDIDALGASLSTGAYADYAYVHLLSLSKNFPQAAEIMRDVVVKPRFLPAEWTRVHALWLNDLRARQSDPDAVCSVVAQRFAFPAGHAYGHPTSGTLASAATVGLADVKKFYAESYRPDAATFVAVGDIGRAELDGLLDRLYGGWRPAAGTATASGGTKAVPDAPSKAGRRVVLVDRPEAPQAVVAFARRGVAGGDPDAPPLVRVNAALGGSFTSRLNQTLREEHGWSYGAKSRFSFAVQKGIFVAQAAVHTEHTGEAVKALLGEIEALARDGLTNEELEKTRMIARADLVDVYETNDGIARRLARYAAARLGAEHEAKASARLDGASKEELRRLAASYLSTSDGVVVVVGPKVAILPQLEKVGLATVEQVGPEGDKSSQHPNVGPK